VDESKPHSCASCKGTGKVVSQRTDVFRGVKKTSEFLVDCPCKLTAQFLSGPSGSEFGKGSEPA